jgi:molybdate transport system substrate-binding protein
MMMTALRTILLALALACCALPAMGQTPITIFAAASLKNALDEVAAKFTASTGTRLKISYAGSMMLARQIEQGAPADLFISADQEVMDYAAEQKLIRAETRQNLLGNRLVVIAPANAPMTELALTPQALAQALATGRLATGDVSSVPAGKYAKQALQKLGLWAVAEPRLAMSDNVRTAMTFVSRGEAPLGIVYASDAASDPGVKIIARFPEGSHEPIVYPLAQTASSNHRGLPALIAFLRSQEARGIFERQGFIVLK